MAIFEYHGPDFARIEFVADDSEEIPIEVAQTFALLEIGTGLHLIGQAVDRLAEEVRDFSSIRVELEK